MDTKALRQKILDLAIHGKLVPQDPNDEPASVLLERIKAEKERLIKEGKIKRSKKSAKTSDTPHYENVPFEIPNSWVWTTIEEICSKIGSGSTPRGSNYSANGIPFFRSQNVYNDRLVYDDIKYISEEVHQKMKGTEVLANDLLLNITGGSLGRCAVVPADFNCGNVSQHVCIMRSVLVEPEYFHALVLSSYFAKSMKITGSGREGLPKYSLEQMAFPLPPLSEQQRIVMEIEKLFALIDQIEHSKVNLQTIIKQTKSKILDLAIHGKLVPQDPNDEPAIELLKRINPDFTPCDNGHYTQLPDGWTFCRLDQIIGYEQSTAYIVESTAYDDSYSTPVLTAGKSFIIGYTNEATGIYSNLPCIIFDDFTTDSKLVDFPFKVKSSAMKILKVHKDIEVDYVAMFMSITKLVGDTHKRYWISEYSKLEIPIPSKAEQKRIIHAIHGIFTQLDLIMESL
ncbi:MULTISPECIES: restriction endonuclease subunit S [Bacteroides]|uniref:restriction endonuclease subunit S n=1 Tax=Bacteroides TaxID=816 RepID=UPI001CD31E23|nr:restriction endonuclease subunit S [Bacteroides thetaiotaomicron]MCS2218557.1 restriction endonuclease subunit S [Bacteroides thetaiotaomicron]MCS2520145.1 restriction endonuclease subunit S [Bacteroides thetaiotaomicron]MCS2628844.1 restriction endonuclease subunit S [Bacteroides thetaiotaomicron]MCS2718970.1 restriction endonuclease subunit S [Bacteroides thetaiotaomicron]MCS2961958.1 restriction endonuclease subunit S [Bacteroides thetaiotaomicron]